MIVKIKQPESKPAEPVLELELLQCNGNISLFGNGRFLAALLRQNGAVHIEIEEALKRNLAELHREDFK